MRKISIIVVGFLLLAGVSLQAGRSGSSFGGAFAGSTFGSMLGTGLASAGRRSDTVVVREGSGSEALRSDIRYLGEKIDKMLERIEQIENRMTSIERNQEKSHSRDED